MTEPADTAASPGGAAPEYRKRRRSNKPIILAIVAVAVVAIVAVALLLVNREGGSAGAGGEANGGGPGGSAPGTELTVGLLLEPTNLDIRNTAGVALDQILIDNVYQGLVGLKSGTVDEFVPVLAEALPEVSDDALTYTFSLREGVRFHSGAELTAADVVDSLTDAEKGFSLRAALGADFAVSAPDAGTVAIRLESPNSQLLWHLANRPGLVFETGDTGSPESTANGTGPYRLDDWKQGDSIAFSANPDYWGEPATLGRVIWRYIPDPNSAVNAVLDGDLDVLAPVDSSLVAQLEDEAGFELVRADGTDVFTLAFNSAKAPLDDPRVRTALSKAIDTDAIIAAFYGDGKPLGGPITELEPGYEDLTAVNAYDPEGARALLAEAGISGLSLTVTMPNFYPTDAINQVVTQFAAVGVTLEVESVEFATWLGDVYTAPADGGPRAFDLSYVDHAEARDFANYANPGYYFGYDSAEVQRLYAESIAATDADRAAELLEEAAGIVASDAPAKWLINYTPTNAVGTNVSGFPSSNTNSRINLQGVTLQQDR